MKMFLIGLVLFIFGLIGPLMNMTGGSGHWGGIAFALVGLVLMFFGFKKAFPRLFVRR